MTRDPVRAAAAIQRQAAAPGRSVALRAGAGSGKTKVLVDRFLRLCIEDAEPPVHPRSVLAITFTRKAAVEVQDRLLQRARELALAAPPELDRLLGDLFGDAERAAPSAAERRRAAGLYEQVLEDLSGLNVGTIHGFCQKVLDRFAVEAGLDPRFTVLENRQELLEEALDRLDLEITTRPELQQALTALGSDPAAVRRSVGEVFDEQMRLERWLEAVDPDGLPTPGAARDRSALRPLLLRDLRRLLFPTADADREPSRRTLAAALAEALEAFAAAGVDRALAALGADAAAIPPKGPQKLRDEATAAVVGLRGPDAAAGDERLDDALLAARWVLLKKDGKPRSFTGLRKDPELKERFQQEVLAAAAPVLATLRSLDLLEVLVRNDALLRLGLRALDLYDELKRRDRVVDFQDLEAMARALLADPVRAPSLLYRLDDRIGHLLLDEFQDTNFNQWDLLQPFVADFLSEAGEQAPRTLFCVGDVKQSIYGFRGAEPGIFTAACDLLAGREQLVATLPTNFRSLGAIVHGVGELFNTPPLDRSLEPAERAAVRQDWSRREPAGEFLALAPYGGADAEAEDDAAAGADLAVRSADQTAADAAVRLVLELKASGTVADDGSGAGPRPLRWSDVLVLCRQRTAIGTYEKAFQTAGIPIVPSGRGMLAASREVQDILALLRWLTWPEDDVALATVLRSPLCRLGAARFEAVLARRDLQRPGPDGRWLPPRGLWSVLQQETADPELGPIVERLRSWRRHLGFENCHDLLRRIYREGEVLERIRLARGEQARYNLERLFDLALGGQLGGLPTVRRLAEVVDRAGRQGGEEEAALPGSEGEGRVRFMTVHAAKGLEAPVVLLVDLDRPAGRKGQRLRLEPEAAAGALLLKVSAAERRGIEECAAVLPPDALQRAERLADARAEGEEGHLLYVAMTRARERLILLGGEPGRPQDPDTPLRRVRSAAAAAPDAGVQLDDPAGLERPPAPPPPAAGAGNVVAPLGRAWTPPTLRARFAVELPSAAEGGLAAAAPAGGPAGESVSQDGVERGTRIHALLQAAAEDGAMPPGAGADRDEAAAVFADPALAWVFRPGTVGGSGRSEAAIIRSRPAGGPEQAPRRVTGFIDRLVVRPDRVDIIDYKTTRTGGDPARLAQLVAHYRPQLLAYREAVAAVYPGRTIGAWLLFTDPALAAGDRLQPVD